MEHGAYASESPFQKVSGSVYVAQMDGGNVVVSRGPDGLVVVDPRAPELDSILEAWAPAAKRTVVNTHSHRDHTAGNRAVAKADGSIIAQAEVSLRLGRPQVFKGMRVGAAPRADWPTRTYVDRLELSLNGERVELIHPPGAHTDGDTLVFFHGSGVVALGDVFFPDRFPYVDPDGGGRVDALIAAIDQLVRELPVGVRLVPGHGRSVCSLDDLRAYQRMLHDSDAWVKSGQAAGVSLDALVSRGAPPAYESWAWPLVPEPLWVRLVAGAP